MTIARKLPTTAVPINVRMTGIRMAQTRGGKSDCRGWSSSTKGWEIVRGYDLADKCKVRGTINNVQAV